MDTLTITDIKGRKYFFDIYPIYTSFKAIPGIYIFMYLDKDKIWRTVYIGETSNFKKRLDLKLSEHHQWPCIQRNEATHIGICVDPKLSNKAFRIEAETDLRNTYPSCCNDQ